MVMLGIHLVYRTFKIKVNIIKNAAMVLQQSRIKETTVTFGFTQEMYSKSKSPVFSYFVPVITKAPRGC